MPVTDCRHRAAADLRRACVHLLDADHETDVEFNKQFTGRGREYDLLCALCTLEPDVAGPHMRRVCVACSRRLGHGSA